MGSGLLQEVPQAPRLGSGLLEEAEEEKEEDSGFGRERSRTLQRALGAKKRKGNRQV